MDNIYQYKPLKERRDTPLVPNNSVNANDDGYSPKRNIACQSGNTPKGDRISVHSVFVLSNEGKPLTPTTPAKARKLLKAGQAEKVWSKFNTFGIRMLFETNNVTPKISLGYDSGSKYEGFSIVVGSENSLNIKLNLPNKKQIIFKLQERKNVRKTRRNKLRYREKRIQNRRFKTGYITPSQLVIVCSRLKIFNAILAIYPVKICAFENITFNLNKFKKYKQFVIATTGKNKIKKFLLGKNIEIVNFTGFQTQKIRKSYNYSKSKNKFDDKMSSHCTDSLSLAIYTNCKKAIPIGKFIVVDDKYRCVRRKLHDIKIGKNNVKTKFSTGTIFGLKKGKLIGTRKLSGILCGKDKNKVGYINKNGKRNYVSLNNVLWISNHFKIKEII